MVPLDAQAIVNYAREQEIKLQRGGIKNTYPKLCARNTILHSIINFRNQNDIPQEIFNNELKFIADKYGITQNDVDDIENGFEGFATTNYSSYYYKLGQEIYRLSRS